MLINLGALRKIGECAQLFYIEAASQFGTNQQAAEVAVVQVWI